MVGISDAVVIGIVLGLIFAAVSYYLYSRVIQLEKKVGLMENILLDLKVTTEQTLLAEIGLPPSRSSHVHSDPEPSEELDTNDVEELTMNDRELHVRNVHVDSSRTTSNSHTYSVVRDTDVVDSVDAVDAVDSLETTDVSGNPSPPTSPSTSSPSTSSVKKITPSINYEANTYKELLGIARQKGVTGGSHMTKSELISALRRKDSGEPVKDVPAAWAALLSGVTNQNDDGVQAELLPADPNTDGSPLDESENSPLGDDEVDSSFVQ
jgi:hypothetical protein